MISRERAQRFHANYHSAPRQRSIETHSHQLDQFKSPSSISADEEQQGSSNTAAPLLNKPPQRKKSFLDKLKSIPGWHWIIIAAISLLLMGGGAAAIWFMALRDQPSHDANLTIHEAPPPPKHYSNLTGLEVDEAVNKRPVTAIMVENSLRARPQSGLLEAGVVFEAIAEGGITRFAALYQDEEPDYIGPVRSARTPWLRWVLGFDATYAHAGGSAEALQLIRNWNIKDMDSMRNPSGYWRISSRAAPHNLYTSIERLRTVQNERGFGEAKYTSLERKEKEEPAGTATAGQIDLNVSHGNYNVRYEWDKPSNTYKRFNGGAAHTDERSGEQIAPKVVVALVMNQGRSGVYYTYDTIGSGPVYIFQDGRVIEGRWHKSSNEDQFKFTNQNGDPVKLNPGQTWFTALGDTNRVTYQP